LSFEGCQNDKKQKKIETKNPTRSYGFAAIASKTVTWGTPIKKATLDELLLI
jgi:hypothetical protein